MPGRLKRAGDFLRSSEQVQHVVHLLVGTKQLVHPLRQCLQVLFRLEPSRKWTKRYKKEDTRTIMNKIIWTLILIEYDWYFWNKIGYIIIIFINRFVWIQLKLDGTGIEGQVWAVEYIGFSLKNVLMDAICIRSDLTWFYQFRSSTKRLGNNSLFSHPSTKRHSIENYLAIYLFSHFVASRWSCTTIL